MPSGWARPGAARPAPCRDCKGGLGAYQRIVLVGGLYAGSMAGLKRFLPPLRGGAP